MTFEKLIQAAGAAAVISALLNLAFFVLHPFSGEPPDSGTVLGSPYVAVHVLGLASMVLLLPSFTALYLVQATRVGWLGFLGYLLGFSGAAMTLGFLWADGFYSRLVAATAPQVLDHGRTLYYSGEVYWSVFLAAVLFDIGEVLFAIASVRAAVLPRAAVILAAAGTVIALLPPPPISALPWGVIIAGAVAITVGQTWLGAFLWREARNLAAGRRAQPVSQAGLQGATR
jgi:hypothetical protein